MRIKGYVVNTYDALNHDIDFPYINKNTPQYKMLDNVISNNYAYKNIMRSGQLSNECYGKSYRCRLNGIEINDQHFDRKRIKSYANDIKKLIDRADGWVECIFKGVDVFNRLLLNIYIPTLNINLCDYLISKSIEDEKPLFNKYVKNKFN